MPLNIKSKEECAFDQISLGEVMLRLDPGEGRIRTARQFLRQVQTAITDQDRNPA